MSMVPTIFSVSSGLRTSSIVIVLSAAVPVYSLGKIGRDSELVSLPSRLLGSITMGSLRFVAADEPSATEPLDVGDAGWEDAEWQ